MKLFGNSHKGGAHAGAAHSGTEDAEIHVSEIRSDDAQADAAVGAVSAAAAKPEGGGKAASESASPEKPKKKTARRVLLIAGAVILALVAAVLIHFLVAGHFFWEEPLRPVAGATPTPSGRGSVPKTTEAPDATQSPEDTPPPEETYDPLNDTEGALHIAADAPRKDGVFTFLLAGIDYYSDSTDTIMVVSFDTKNHTISGTSIPRDTMVNIGWATTPKKINAVYPGYNNSGRDGKEGLRTHVKNILGFDVDYYAFVSLEAVEHAVDAVGGVDFDVPEDMVYWDPTQNLRINILHGMQHLDGEDAVKLCRYRITYAGGDLQRIGVQHDFLKALASQVIKKISISNIGALVDILYNDVETDMTSGNLAWLGRQFLSCDAENITFQTAPNYASGINDVSLVGLIVNDWLEMINGNINPYLDDVTTGNVNILTFNYGGSSIGSTTGSIAGGWDSFYCLSCTGKSGSVVYHAPGAHLSFPDATKSENESGADSGEAGAVPEPGTQPGGGMEPAPGAETEPAPDSGTGTGAEAGTGTEPGGGTETGGPEVIPGTETMTADDLFSALAGGQI